ncbi:hypothetical protein ACWCYY_20720 [Kitasatospora sp. NPDC001664]
MPSADAPSRIRGTARAALEQARTTAAAQRAQRASGRAFHLLEAAVHDTERAGQLDRAVIEFWDAVSAFATTARTALHP